MKKGFLILEDGTAFQGVWNGGVSRAGEVVFNTAHSGYEEISTDPSYFQQIVVMTAPMQGNYGVEDAVWESRGIWIDGFICLEMQATEREDGWKRRLIDKGVPILSEVDTRTLVLKIREQGTPWGALVCAETQQAAEAEAFQLIREKKKLDKDWVFAVSRKEAEILPGHKPGGPRVAGLDFGCKTNTLRELRARCSEVKIFPARTSPEEILKWKPHGLLLSNGPGDPADVQDAAETVRELLGKVPMMGICMGHQILGRALGGRTFRLKFGHRGSNHPVRDLLLNRIYVTSQNHGYAIDQDTLPKNTKVTHINLNDGTVSGIECAEWNCFSVQFHPESHPGPHEAVQLFDLFMTRIT